MATTNTEVQVPTMAAPSSNDMILPPLGHEGAGSVALIEVARIAFTSLLANKVRALLTMLGVIIGVAAVIALLALGGGASSAITGQVQALGTNVLTIRPGSPNTQMMMPGAAQTAQTLTLADSDAIAALKLPIVGPAPQFGASAQVVAPAADKQAQVVGSTAASQVVSNLTLSSGVFIDESQVRGASPVVVLGATLAQNLFGSGQTVRIKGQTLRVIGVLAPKGETMGGGSGGSIDDQAFVPLSVAQQRLFGAHPRRQWMAGRVDRAVGNQQPGHQRGAGADLNAAARAA